MAGICNLCGLPDELCICQEIAKEQQKATISVVRRRYGKMVTIVEGIEDTAIDLGQLAKILKGACASGGTVKGWRCDRWAKSCTCLGCREQSP